MRNSIGFSPWLSVAGAVGSLAIATTAQGSLIAQEGFGEYPAGGHLGTEYYTGHPANITTPGPNTGLSSYNSDNAYQPFTIGSGNLTYPGLASIADASAQKLAAGDAGGQGAEAYVDTSAGGLFGQAGYIGAGNTYVGVPGKTLYFSFLFQITSDTGGTPTNGGADQPSLTLVGPSTSVQVGQNYGSPDLWIGGHLIQPLDSNTHLIVMQMTYGASSSTDALAVYLDPTIGTPLAQLTPTVTETTPLEFNEVRFLTQGNEMNYDEFRFGTTYADVAPSSTPEPASLGVLAPSVLLMLRRRKK